MKDVPCRIAQAHTAAEQTRKWDEGRRGKKLEKTENVKLSPFPLPNKNEGQKMSDEGKHMGGGKVTSTG